MSTSSQWRRSHIEGPIDDRWTSLSFQLGESGGEVRIVEGRKEWNKVHQGSSNAAMSYYTTEFPFPRGAFDELQQVDDMSFMLTEEIEVPHTALPTNPILRLQKFGIFPDLPPQRLPHNVHPVHHDNVQSAHTRAKPRIRDYDISANKMLDLACGQRDWQGTQRLRLRSESRQLRPPLQDRQDFLQNPSYDLALALERMYIVPPISYWPPAQNLESEDESLEAIYTLLRPPSHLGNVYGTADERSFVFATGDPHQPQAIIFVSFDPAIKLEGI